MALSPDREVRWGLESRSGARPADARAAAARSPARDRTGREILRSALKRNGKRSPLCISSGLP